EALVDEEVPPADVGHRRAVAGRSLAGVAGGRWSDGPGGGDGRRRPLVGGREARAAEGDGRDDREKADLKTLHTAPTSVVSCSSIAAASASRSRSAARARRLASRRTTTKNTGVKMTPRKVPPIMPPSTPVPMARCAPEPAPVAVASGSTPS